MQLLRAGMSKELGLGCCDASLPGSRFFFKACDPHTERDSA